MKLRTRLLLTHGFIAALTLLVLPLTLLAIERLAARVDLINDETVRGIRSTERIRQQLNTEERELLREALQPDTRKASAADLNAVRTAISAARPYFASGEEQAALDELEKRYAAFEQSFAEWRSAESADAARDLPDQFSALRDSVVRLRDLKNKMLRQTTDATRGIAQDLFFLLAGVGVLAAGLGLFAILRMVRSIAQPVDQLNALVQRMSQGDFEIAYHEGPIHEFNTLGRHFETMGRALRLFHTSNLEQIVTEQRRTEAVLDSIGDGLAIFSEEGRVERMNPVAERQLGIAPGAAIGKRFEEFSDAAVGARISEALKFGEAHTTVAPEIQIERDGEQRTLTCALTQFVESTSGRSGVVMVMRDVTVQRGFDRMRNEFMLRASHELRTPLASIRMGLGLLEEKLEFPQGSRDRELYETVQQELQRMITLLSDLLDLSRLRTGDHNLELAPTDVPQMVEEVRERHHDSAEQLQIALTVNSDAAVPRLLLCRSAFDRVFDNLLTNALRHTPAGGAIAIGVRKAPHHLALSVADSGEGIAYAQQALIFQPFVQIGSKRGGAGLGLAICREIVRQHGGEISLQSQPKHGTTFTITLPI